MGFMDGLQSIGSGGLQGLKDMVGANQKAVIEIADFSTTTAELKQAPRPTDGAGRQSIGGIGSGGKGSFDAKSFKQFASAARGSPTGAGDFVMYSGFKKYRFECQFNPEEISISGYGGEELPIQNFMDEGSKSPSGSHMASANTRIDMNFKLVFDKTNIQDAFYIDKFTLSGTNIAKGAATAVKQGINTAKGNGSAYTVQPEVEALTAIVRDNNKRLARFIWGDMIYEGVINTVSAEYVMFNVNCEPIRAYVNLGMVLYDEEVAGAHGDTWAREYLNDIYSIRSPGISDIGEEELDTGFGGMDDYSKDFQALFGGL